MEIPREIEESAFIDGANVMHILLPMVKPTLATLAIVSFIGAWNNFLWPLLVLDDSSMFPFRVRVVQIGGDVYVQYAVDRYRVSDCTGADYFSVRLVTKVLCGQLIILPFPLFLLTFNPFPLLLRFANFSLIPLSLFLRLGHVWDGNSVITKYKE